MNTLKLTLYKRYFDEILSGIKTEEYRLIKPRIEKMLEKEYRYVEFTNGYGHHRPKILVEYLGFYKKKITIDLFSDQVEVIAIRLGRIVEAKNIEYSQITANGR